MDLEQIMKELEAKIDGCKTIPIWGRGIIDKEELLDLIQDMQNKFPEELKQAKWVKEERQRIINDAHQEAADMIKATEEKIAAMVNEHDITQQASSEAARIMESANQNARDIRRGANQYADDVLRALEDELIKTAETIRANRNGSR